MLSRNSLDLPCEIYQKYEKIREFFSLLYIINCQVLYDVDNKPTYD